MSDDGLDTGVYRRSRWVDSEIVFDGAIAGLLGGGAVAFSVFVGFEITVIVLLTLILLGVWHP